MRVHYPKLRNIVHTILLECFTAPKGSTLYILLIFMPKNCGEKNLKMTGGFSSRALKIVVHSGYCMFLLIRINAITLKKHIVTRRERKDARKQTKHFSDNRSFP